MNTDKEIKANRPDIIIKDKEEKKCVMADMSISTEINVSNKEVESSQSTKILKLKQQKC